MTWVVLPHQVEEGIVDYPVIGQPLGPRQKLHAAVVAAASDLRGQLQALNQQRHAGAEPEDVAAVQAAIFDRAQGYGRHG